MLLVTNPVREFKKNLEFAEQVDIASAWATQSQVLKALVQTARKRRILVRAIIGTSRNVTEPDALKQLHEIGDLRLISDEYRLFHPKIILFRSQGKSLAWIGSANFTRGGFERNEETIFETDHWQAAWEWFTERWSECGETSRADSARAIEDYDNLRKANPPKRRDTHFVDPDRYRIDLLKHARGWAEYVSAVQRCDKWWNSHSLNYRDGPFTVLGKERSWFHTISKLGPEARTENWSAWETRRIGRLLGKQTRDSIGNWALLGNLRSSQVSLLQKDGVLLNEIGQLVNQVAEAADVGNDEFLAVLHDSISEIYRLRKGIKRAVATRLLALACPDRCVSVNGPSTPGLREIFPNVTDPGTADGYCELLKELYKQPWYNVDEPDDPCEKKLWSMRAALMDCFVYDRAQ